jgi:exopolysaccharide production protein ExoZ
MTTTHASTPPAQEAQLDALQALRGIAALAVVLMHFKEYMARFSPGLAAVAEYGYVGVDVFFLISGFIIYHATRADRSRQALPFLVRRLCRVVLPAWFAMVVLVFIKPPYLIDLVRGLMFLPRETAHPPYLGHGFLIVAWTLTYELVFYGVFAAALTTRWDALATQPVGRSTSVQQFSLWPLVTLLSSPMLLEFVLGIGLAAAFSRSDGHPFSRYAGVVALLGVVLVGVGIWQVGLTGHGLTRAGVFALGVVLLTLAAQAALNLRRRAPTGFAGGLLRVTVWLGGCSYSLYLVHPLVRALAQNWVPQLQGLALAALTAGAIAASIGAAALMHRWVELPAQALGKWLAQRLGGPVAVRAAGQAA